MPTTPFSDLGAIGLIPDLPEHKLPPNAWSAAQNVRFHDGKVQRMEGYASVYETVSDVAHFVFPVQTHGYYFWLYATAGKGAAADKVYAYASGSHNDITKSGGLTASLTEGWTGTVLGGIPVLNNGSDAPQQWSPADVGTLLTDLSNWPASTFCAALRSYKSFLIALDVTESGVRNRRLLRWSDAADPGTVPGSWDYTSTTNLAGRTELAETTDFLVDCAPLGDANIVYKNNSIWSMRFVGAPYVFRFAPIAYSIGALGRNCIYEFGGRHLVFGYGDVVVHAGNADPQSILKKRMQKWLRGYAESGEAANKHSFVVGNPADHEVWVCFPSSGATYADTALVWNWVTGAVGIKDLPNCQHIANGLVEVGTDVTWDGAWAAATLWNDAQQFWEDPAYEATLRKLLMTTADSAKLFRYAGVTTEDGSGMAAYVERKGLPLLDPRRGVVPDGRKLITRVWLQIDGTAGQVVQVTVGGQETVNGSLSTEGPFNYTIGTTRYIDVVVNTVYPYIKIASTANVVWELGGMDIEWEYGGRI